MATKKVLNLPYFTPIVDPRTGTMTQSWQNAFSQNIIPAINSSNINTTTPIIWGDITGSINDQTDLINILATKQNTLGFTPINKAGDSGVGQLVGTSFNYITGLSNTLPLAAGTASIGISTLVSREDHVHAPNTTRVEINDIDYTVTEITNQILVYTDISASRLVTLPTAIVAGQTIEIFDEYGKTSETNQIQVAPHGSDIIEKGRFSNLVFPYASVKLQSSGSGTWNVIYTNNVYPGAGVLTAPSYADLGTGSITIGSGVYTLFSNISGLGRIKSYNVAGGTFTLPDNSLSYLVCNYNVGNPIVQLITDITLIDEITIVPIITLYREGTLIHTLKWDTLGKALPNKTHESIIKTQRFRRESGSSLGEAATRRIIIGQGVIWYGAIPISISAFTSATDSCYLYYHTAPNVWTETPITQYNNSQYDDNTGGLKSLTGSSKYAVNFIYQIVSDTTKRVYVVLGQDNYLLGDAQLCQPPSSLPPEISSMAILVGRIIVANGSTTATQIDSTFATQFSPSAINDHNLLYDLQGGTASEYYHLTSAEHTVATQTASTVANGVMSSSDKAKLDGLYLQPPPSITKEITGFIAPESIIVTYDTTARTITLTGTVAAYWQGTLLSSLISGWVSDPHPAGNNTYYLYYNGSAFVWSTSLWSFDMLQIAFVNYGATYKFGIRECHGMMQWQAHEEFHQTLGTYLESGGDLSGYVLASTTAANRRPAVAASVVHDEDIQTTIPLLATGSYTQATLTGSATNVFTAAAAEIVPVLAANPYYNAFSTPNWVQTLMANNSYMCVWCVAVPVTSDTGSQVYRYLWMQGQSNGNLASQQALSFSSLNLGTLAAQFTEFVPLTKIIIRYTGGNWDITSVEKLLGTKVAAVSFTGGITSVVVTAPITGSGVAADPLVIAAATDAVPGYMTAADHTLLTGKATDSLVVHLAGTETITGQKYVQGAVPIILEDTHTATTNKNARFAATAYDITQVPVALAYANSLVTTNVVAIGGGTSAMQAATSVRIYAAAAVNTSTGTLVTSWSNVAMTMADAVNIVVGTTTGTQIGTGATQKLGFYGATPVVKPTALTATATTAPAGGTGATAGAYDTAANRNIMIACVQNTKTRLDELETKLKALGILT